MVELHTYELECWDRSVDPGEELELWSPWACGFEEEIIESNDLAEI